MDGWIYHDGGPQPVSDDTKVLVIFRDGYKETFNYDGPSPAGYWGDAVPGPNIWKHTGGGSDIVGYRIIA